MTASVAEFPTRTLRLDNNGLPLGHASAQEAVLGEFMDLVNELPESVYFLNRNDAEWIADVLLRRYLAELKQAQR